MQSVQLILDDAHSGAWNMAVDEALLNESLKTGTTFVRMYRWSEATISLGHFQQLGMQPLEERFASLPVVRRLSGGGAILHHHEQTYSCVVPPGHPLANHPYQLYESVHAAIIAELLKQNVRVAVRGQDRTLSREPFLCFLREAAMDLVWGETKVLGSAQRRRRGAVLQHGSLLLRASPHAPELPGLVDLVNPFSEPDSLADNLGSAIAGVLGTRWEIGPLPKLVREAAHLI